MLHQMYDPADRKSVATEDVNVCLSYPHPVSLPESQETPKVFSIKPLLFLNDQMFPSKKLLWTEITSAYLYSTRHQRQIFTSCVMIL